MVVGVHATLVIAAVATTPSVVVPAAPMQVMMLAEPPAAPAPQTPPETPPPEPVPPPPVPPPVAPPPERAISEAPPPPVSAPVEAPPAPAPAPAAPAPEALQTLSLADGTVRIVYPALSRRLGEEGVVMLRIRVEADGSISVADLLRSSGFARLDEAARRGVLAGRMRPATRGGEAIAMDFRLPVQFLLR